MRRSAANQASISLFPFLAVLICTMGALVLLLLGLTQSMRHRMSRPAAPVAVASTAPAPSALATVAPPAPEPRAPAPESPAGYDRDALMAAHERERAELAARYAARVTSAREELAQLQSRLTDLQARRTKEESQVGDLASQGEFQTNRSQAARVALELAEEKLAELDRQRNELKKEVALTERRLAELQARQTTVSNAFAIVPYEGRSGTQRRPISIECTDKGFRFLPEQVLVGTAELRGGTARVNALGMGTRALLRYWTLKHAREPAKNPKPYVLLLVRPSGIYGYDAARQLLAGLETSFGYELIDEKLELSSPPPDPQAVAVLKEAIQLAMESSDPAAVAQSRKQVWDEELQRPVEQGRRATSSGGAGAPGEQLDDRIDGGGDRTRDPIATTPRGKSGGTGAPAGPTTGPTAAHSPNQGGDSADRALAGTPAGTGMGSDQGSGDAPGTGTGTATGPGTGTGPGPKSNAPEGARGPLVGGSRGRTGVAGGPRPTARPATLGGGRADLADETLTTPPDVGVPTLEEGLGVNGGLGGPGSGSGQPGSRRPMPTDAPPARLPPPGQPLAAAGGPTGTGLGTEVAANGSAELSAGSPGGASPGTAGRSADNSPFPGVLAPGAGRGTDSGGTDGMADATAPQGEPANSQGSIPGSRRPPLTSAKRSALTEPLPAPGADSPGYAEIPQNPPVGGGETAAGASPAGTAADQRSTKSGSSATGTASETAGTPEANPFLREITPETPPLAASQRPQTPGRPRAGSSTTGGQGRPTNERSPISKPDPNDPLPSGPGGGGSGLPALGGKRGTGPQRNLIGLERKIRIRVEPTRVLVGDEQPLEIVVKRGMKSEQLVGQVTAAMGQVVEDWGAPPARFYWIPAVRFEVTREGNAVYERLRGAFERNQVKSSVDYVTPAGQTVEKEDR